MLQLVGRGPIAVPHQVGTPVIGDHGLPLLQFALDPAAPGHTAAKPSKYKLRVTITGAANDTIQLNLWARDGEGWSIPGETGNFGIIGGSAVGPGTYTFPLEDMGMYDEVMIVPSNATGAAALAAATLTSILERAR